MSQEYLIKRSVEKDGLPKKEGRYFCECRFVEASNYLSMQAINFDTDAGAKEPSFNIGRHKVEYWYEPVTLHEIMEQNMTLTH